MAICGQPAKYGTCWKYVSRLIVCQDGRHIFACYYHAPIVQSENCGSEIYNLEVITPQSDMCDKCDSYSVRDVMICRALCLAWCYDHKHPVEWRVVNDFLATEQARMQQRNNSIERQRHRKEAQERAAQAQEKLF